MWERKCPVILPKFRLPHKFSDPLHAVNLRHGTDDFTSPPKEGVLRIFRPKNPTASVGFEPANLGTKDSTLPLDHRSPYMLHKDHLKIFFGSQETSLIPSSAYTQFSNFMLKIERDFVKKKSPA